MKLLSLQFVAISICILCVRESVVGCVYFDVFGYATETTEQIKQEVESTKARIREIIESYLNGKP